MPSKPVSAPRAQVKLAIVTAWVRFRADSGLSIAASQAAFAAHYNAGKIALEVGPHIARPYVSERTLRRWVATLRKHGPSALAGRYGLRKRSGKIDSSPELREFILGMLTQHPRARAVQFRQGLLARFNGAVLPSLTAVERWLARWRAENPQLALLLADPDAFRHKHQSAVGSAAEAVTRLNQLWELDSTLADVMLQGGRHALVAVIDVYSRRSMLLVSKTSNSTAIAALLRKAILAWGVPEKLKMDNGADYSSIHIEQVIHNLEIEREFCTPYTPQEKPHVERHFGTFARGPLELLPGFIGHSVADRRAIDARAGRGAYRTFELNQIPEEFQSFCDRWCADLYAHQVHGELAGRTPFQVANDWPEPVRRVPDGSALNRLVSRPVDGGGTRNVTKCELRVDGRFYSAPELVAVNGRRVSVEMDDSDLGRIYVYLDDQFICIAECPEITGTSRAELAARVKAAQRALLSAQKKDLKAIARRVGAKGIGMEIMDDAKANAAQVVSFPRESEPYMTHALDEGAKAAEALAAKKQPHSDSARASANDGALAKFNELRGKQYTSDVAPKLPSRAARR